MAATRERRLLLWDDFRAHKTDRAKTCANDVCNTDLVIVHQQDAHLCYRPQICLGINYLRQSMRNSIMSGLSVVVKSLTRLQATCAHHAERTVSA